MSTDSHPDSLDPSGGSVGGDQDGWQAPGSGSFDETPPYPSQGSSQSGYGSYQTPPVGQPGYGPGYTPPMGQPGYGPGYTPPMGQPGYGPGHTPPSGSVGYPSVIAPKPSIIPLRPLSIGEILGGAFESLRANPKAMFVPSMLVMTIIGVISTAGVAFFASQLDLPGLTRDSGSGEVSDAEFEAFLESSWSSLTGIFSQYALLGVLTMFAASVLAGLLIVTVSRTILGRKASLGDVWKRIRPRVGALIGQAIVIQLILNAVVAAVISLVIGSTFAFGVYIGFTGHSSAEGNVGIALLVILGSLALLILVCLGIFALSCKLCLAPAALVLENIGVFAGISRSWSLTRGYFWRVIGIRLLSTIIISLVSGSASSALSFLTNGLSLLAPDQGALIVLGGSLLVSSILQAVTMPFDSAVVALIYTDLRMRSEGLDVELRRAAGV